MEPLGVPKNEYSEILANIALKQQGQNKDITKPFYGASGGIKKWVQQNTILANVC